MASLLSVFALKIHFQQISFARLDEKLNSLFSALNVFLFSSVLSYLSGFELIIAHNVPTLGEVAKFGTDYFRLKIKFLAKRIRELTTKFAI